MIHKARTTLVSGLLILAMTGVSFAEVLFVGSRKAATTDTNTTFDTFVPLIDTGSFTVGFATSQANETVVFTYNAECRRGGTQGFVGLKLVVDGDNIAHPQTANDFAMCSSADRVAAVRQSFRVIGKAGNHTLRIFAAALGGATSWTLDDSSILIQN